MPRNLLESKLRKAGRLLADWQVARFWKVPEELMQTPCDFMGFTVTGRAVLIEAKQVKRSSLPIGKEPGLAPHQFHALNEANKAGALALLCWANDGILATLSFDMVLELSRDRRSIPWAKIEERFLRSFDASIDPVVMLEPWLRARST